MVKRMPVIKGKSKTVLDVPAIVNVLRDWDPDYVFVERQQSMPGQGVASSFLTGQNYGILIGVLAGLRYPAVWKRLTGAPKDKKLVRQRASEIFPNNAEDWRFARDDGLAEAAMIAEYGLRKTGFGRHVKTVQTGIFAEVG